MQVCREPTNPDAWGRATFDVALLALPIGKLGQASKAAGRAGKASSVFAKAEIASVERIPYSSNGVLGHTNWELKYPKFQETTRQTGKRINEIHYSGHALDQMQNRGIMPSIVENTIKNGEIFKTKPGTIGYYDPINNIRVVVNSSTGKVVTTIPGAP